jgi:hypothetical protein
MAGDCNLDVILQSACGAFRVDVSLRLRAIVGALSVYPKGNEKS